MTSKEAIKEINLLKKLFRDNEPLIALALAINALEREETCFWKPSNPSAPMFGSHSCSACGQKTANIYYKYCPNCGRKVEK